MLTVEECRKNADQCIAMAERAEKEHVAALHKIAETWLRLAKEILNRQACVNAEGQNARPIRCSEQQAPHLINNDSHQ